MVNLKTRCPKGEAIRDGDAAISPEPTSTSASWWTFWARASKGCRPGPATRCPRTGPTGEHPLLKDWKPKSARGGQRRAAAPGTPRACREKGDTPRMSDIEQGRHRSHRPAAPGPQGAGELHGRPAGREDRRRAHALRLQPPRHREGLRAALLHAGPLPRGARLRHLLLLPLHRVRPGGGGDRRPRASPRALYIRTIIAELERIHSHLLWLGVAGHEIGFDTLLMYTWRDREQVMILLARLTGNRVNYGMNTLGGVRRDIAPEMIPEILKVVDSLEERTKYYIELALREQTLSSACPASASSPRRTPCGWAPWARRPAHRGGPGHAARRPLRRVRRGERSRWSRTTTATCTAGRLCGWASSWSPIPSSASS